MTGNAYVEVIRRLAAPVAAALGLELWGIEIVPAGRTIVRIFVEALPGTVSCAKAAFGAEGDPQGPALSVDVEQCASFSRMLAPALDAEDLFQDPYTLEVSSPGFSRTFFQLEQMVPYVGDEVEVQLHEAHPDWEGRRKFRGILTAVDADVVVLTVQGVPREEGGTKAVCVRIPWHTVRRASRIQTFHLPEKPGHSRKSAGK